MSERIWEILKNAFFRILIPGIKVTIPLAALSFAFAFIIALAVALVQFANVKGLKQLSRFYVWIIRGTPVLVQLYIVFFGLPKIGITLTAFPAAVIVFSIN